MRSSQVPFCCFSFCLKKKTFREAQSCSELLTATAIRKGSLDNTSALVIDLRRLLGAAGEETHWRSSNRAGGGIDAFGGGGSATEARPTKQSPNRDSSTHSSKPAPHGGGNGSGGGGAGIGGGASAGGSRDAPDGVGVSGNTGGRARPSSSSGALASLQVRARSSL